MLWSMQERKSDAYAGMKVPEAGKALGATWKTMDEAARAPWVEASKEDHARHAREMASYVPPPDVAAAAAIEPGTPDRDGPCQGSLHADARRRRQVWTGMRSQKLWARSERRLLWRRTTSS